MTLAFVRAFFLLLSISVGYYIGFLTNKPILGIQIGALSGLVLIFLENRLRHVSLRGLSSVVSYLEDGTMVVVGQARSLIGKKVKTVVTSVLQTQAGKMVFARLDKA